MLAEGVDETPALRQQFLVALESLAPNAAFRESALRLAAVLRVGVGDCVDDTRNSRGDDRVCARAHAPRLRAGLEGHVDRRALENLCAVPRRVLDRGDFGVVLSGLFVPALADYLAALHYHCADRGIRPCVSKPARRKLDCPLHKLSIPLQFSLRLCVSALKITRKNYFSSLPYLSRTALISVLDLGVENQLARSIASLMTTGFGTSDHFISHTPILRTARSIVPRR